MSTAAAQPIPPAVAGKAWASQLAQAEEARTKKRAVLRQLALAGAIVLAVAVVYYGGRLIRDADRFTIEDTRPLTAHLDGLRYRVHGGHADPQKATEALAALNGRVIALLRHLRAHYVRGEGAANAPRRKAVERLLRRYNPDNLAENSPTDPTGDTSYTIDKGAIVAICLRPREGPRGEAGAVVHDTETLTFVTFHEMAHIAVEEVDHPPPFWAAFKFLLLEAEAAGIYNNQDFARDPRRYCGVTINYNPALDQNLRPI